MKKVKLSELVGKMFTIDYLGTIYVGKIRRENIWNNPDYPFYYLVFKSAAKKWGKVQNCITTVYLRQEDLKYFNENKLISNKNFHPEWDYCKEEKEYAELEQFLEN